MPCNCSKKAKATSFTYIAPDGTSKKYATEVEAKAAQIRAGGGGEVKVG